MSTPAERYIASQLARLLIGQQAIARRLNIIETKETDMSEAVDRITASVATITSRDDSIIALVGNLAQEIRDANTSNDPAINALADSLDAESAKVLDAVNANTPAPAPAPPAA